MLDFYDKNDSFKNNLYIGFQIMIFFFLIIGGIKMGLGIYSLEYESNFTQFTFASIILIIGCIYGLLNPNIEFDYKLPFFITIITLLCSYLLFIAEYKGVLDNTIGSLVTMFGKVIEFFEDNSYGEKSAKGMGILTFLGLLIAGIVTITNDNTKRSVSKGVGIGIFFSVLLVILFGGHVLLKMFRNGKVGTSIYEKVMSRPKTFWLIFSLFSMGTAIPMAFNYDNIDDEDFKKDIKACNTKKEKEGGGFSMDTQAEINECEEESRKKYESKLPLKEFPLLALFIFLLCGFGVISRKEIFEFLVKDKFRNVIVLIAITLLICFIVFQVNSERYYVGNYPRTKTESAIPDSYYIPLNLTFIALGTLCFLSLITLSWNVDNYDRPDTNKIWENTKWLSGKLAKYFKLLFTLIVSAAIIFFSIYFYTGKKTYESGTANIVYMMLGLALANMLYGALKPKLSNLPFLKVLLNLILLVPCLLFFMVEFIYNDVKDTPKVVFAVLLGEIILVSLYVIVPLMLKYFFGHYVGKNNINTYELKKEQLDVKLGELKSYYDSISNRVKDVVKREDWESRSDILFIKN